MIHSFQHLSLKIKINYIIDLVIIIQLIIGLEKVYDIFIKRVKEENVLIFLYKKNLKNKDGFLDINNLRRTQQSYLG